MTDRGGVLLRRSVNTAVGSALLRVRVEPWVVHCTLLSNWLRVLSGGTGPIVIFSCGDNSAQVVVAWVADVCYPDEGGEERVSCMVCELQSKLERGVLKGLFDLLGLGDINPVERIFYQKGAIIRTWARLSCMSA